MDAEAYRALLAAAERGMQELDLIDRVRTLLKTLGEAPVRSTTPSRRRRVTDEV